MAVLHLYVRLLFDVWQNVLCKTYRSKLCLLVTLPAHVNVDDHVQYSIFERIENMFDIYSTGSTFSQTVVPY